MNRFVGFVFASLASSLCLRPESWRCGTVAWRGMSTGAGRTVRTGLVTLPARVFPMARCGACVFAAFPCIGASRGIRDCNYRAWVCRVWILCLHNVGFRFGTIWILHCVVFVLVLLEARVVAPFAFYAFWIRVGIHVFVLAWCSGYLRLTRS